MAGLLFRLDENHGHMNFGLRMFWRWQGILLNSFWKLVSKCRILNRTAYEIKSPISDKVDAIERNIVRALEKCPNIVFDSSRMGVRDDQVLRELIKRRKKGKGMKGLLFINKKGSIVDIEKII